MHETTALRVARSTGVTMNKKALSRMAFEMQSDKWYGLDIACMSGGSAKIEATLTCLSEAPFDRNLLGRFR